MFEVVVRDVFETTHVWNVLSSKEAKDLVDQIARYGVSFAEGKTVIAYPPHAIISVKVNSPRGNKYNENSKKEGTHPRRH